MAAPAQMATQQEGRDQDTQGDGDADGHGHRRMEHPRATSASLQHIVHKVCVGAFYIAGPLGSRIVGCFKIEFRSCARGVDGVASCFTINEQFQ